MSSAVRAIEPRFDVEHDVDGIRLTAPPGNSHARIKAGSTRDERARGLSPLAIYPARTHTRALSVVCLWPRRPFYAKYFLIDLTIRPGPRFCGGELCNQRETNGPLTA
jgi:hypothetical protein